MFGFVGPVMEGVKDGVDHDVVGASAGANGVPGVVELGMF